MYNRYIPASDGTFRREIVPDFPKNSPKEPITVQFESIGEQSETVQSNAPQADSRKDSRPLDRRQSEKHANEAFSSNTGIMRQFLPPSVDTGDLLVLLILLLLLVDGDEDDYLSVILTIAAFILL